MSALPMMATNDRAGRYVRVAVVTAQLAVVTLVVREFRLESRTLLYVLLLALAAYPVHALLPSRLRLPAFGLVSLIGLALALQPMGALLVVGTGALLILLCHLPVGWWVRVALVAGVALGLGLLRAGRSDISLPAAAWPVLGSMFMFRLALYLHAIRHQDAPTGFWRVLSYFFMLPNVAFPLFPVVDYKTFAKGRDEGQPFVLHEQGLRWIVRGTFHLLLYRLVYQEMTLVGADVRSLGELVRFMTSTFLMYLRVSGQFHLVVGLLHLFGFRLPETHHLYYLASSFTDLWRRINLYWTDFMMKLVYYPSFFRLRKLGELPALLLSTAVVFVVTWLLHIWQWFWLLGKAVFTVPDALFWGILGTAVILTTLWERSRPRPPAQRGWKLSRGLKVVGMFLAMSALWSLWSSDSVGEWASLFTAVRETDRREVTVLAALLVAGVLATGWPWGARRLGPAPTGDPALRRQLRDGGFRLVSLGAVLLLAVPGVQNALPGQVGNLTRSLGQQRLNARDEAELQRGYYEELNSASRLDGQVWDLYARIPTWWRGQLDDTPAWQARNDDLLADLAPASRMTYKGQAFTTNEWGMRDRSYSLEKPAGVYRIALLGSSVVMGYGVGDGETFEAQLETQLGHASKGNRVEILNFGLEGHSLVQQLATLEERALRFDPDVVVVSFTPVEHRLTANHLWRVLNQGVRVRYDTVAAVMAAAGLEVGDGSSTVLRRLRPYDRGLARWALQAMVERIRAAGASPVALALRVPTQERGRLGTTMELAAQAGFRVVDLSRVFKGRNEDSLRLAAWDRHPNREGHRLLAEALEAQLLPELEGGGIPVSNTSTQQIRR